MGFLERGVSWLDWRSSLPNYGDRSGQGVCRSQRQPARPMQGPRCRAVFTIGTSAWHVVILSVYDEVYISVPWSFNDDRYVASLHSILTTCEIPSVSSSQLTS